VIADGAQSSVSVRRAGRVVGLRALATAADDVAALAAEVRWTLAALGEMPPTVVVAGPHAVPALATALAERTGIPVLPLERATSARVDDLAACAVAAGLVVGGAGGLRLGGTETPAGSWRTAAALAAAAALLAAGNLGLWHARLARRDVALRDAIRSAAAAVLPDSPLTAPRTELEAAVASLERGGAHDDAAGALALLRETSARVPASIHLDLDELVVEPGALRLGGRAPGFEAVEALRRALAASPLLASVTAEEARATVDGQSVEFRMRAERRRVPGTSS
jgi:Tfp pilus assembly protein PilN